MTCGKCKKEEETIKIAGQLYCAACGSLLEAGREKSEVKVPKIEPTQAEIRTEQPLPNETPITPEVEELSKETNIKTTNIDELGGSGLLLDILSDNAKDIQTEDNIQKQEDLLQASTAVMDSAIKNTYKSPPVPKKMHDIISQKTTKEKDYLENLFDKTLKEAEKIEKKEVEEIKDKVGNEKGYTRLNVDYFLTILAIFAIIILLWIILKLALLN